MKRLLFLLLLCSCGSFGPPDQKPSLNLAHVTRLVKKDPDLVDAPANAQAIAVAQGLADQADKSGVGSALTAIGDVAGSTGTPWGAIIQVACASGVAILGALHVKNARKVDAVVDTVDQHAAVLAASPPVKS